LTHSKLPNVAAPNLSFIGGYVEAGWVIHRRVNPLSTGDAAFARPKVDNPFTFDERGIGAWELSARWGVTN
jgi:phosphate-selective porin OprO and OprP